jgi:hypothetical protein
MRVQAVSNLQDSKGEFEPKIAGEIFEFTNESRAKALIEIGFLIEIKENERPIKESKGSIQDGIK